MDNVSLVRTDVPQNMLLVEGGDDGHVLKNLLSYNGIACRYRNLLEYEEIQEGLIQIASHDGIDNLIESLEVRLKVSSERRIGIIVDADVDITARWQSLRDKLIRIGYNPVPLVPDPGGTILEQEDLPITGVWLMPDNRLPGMLEDFVSFLVPTNDLLWPIAERTLQQVMQTECHFLPEHKSKARIHTWLAWQKKPGTPMGQAITARYLDASATQAQQLINWIRRLFDTEPNEN